MKKTLFFLITLSAAIPGLQAQSSGDDLVLKAMQDEMTRDLNEFHFPGHEKPFFLMFGVKDRKTNTISASLGSILQSVENQDRFRSTARVLVGDYDFNDESLEDDHTTPATESNIELPLDNDYLGIRRSFWSSTEAVYRSAARNFERNKEALHDTGKKLQEIPHKSFVRSKPVILLSPAPEDIFDKIAWESRVKELSSLFENHPLITNSSVVVNYSRGTRYMTNSEGTRIKTPFSIVSFAALALSKSPEGERSVNAVMHIAARPEQLPDQSQLKKEIGDLILRMEQQSAIPKLETDYSGPVLLIGRPVAEAFLSSLLLGRGGIAASDNVPSLKGVQFDMESGSNESYLKKNVLNEEISVTARPHLKTFGGVDLLGSFEADDEGVVPPNEIRLVDHGVLKMLLDNRTSTGIGSTVSGFTSGPGVLHIQVEAKNSEKVLKKKLIEAAKKQKLEYAIIYRNNGEGKSNDVYKVHVKDGREELIRGARIEQISAKELRRLMGASENYVAHNIGNPVSNQSMISVIAPSAMLIDDIEVGRLRMPIIKDDDYVSSPVK